MCFFFSTSSPFPCLICNDYVIRAARQKGGATIISVRDQAEITRSPSYSCHGNDTSKNTGCHCLKKKNNNTRNGAQDFSSLSLSLAFSLALFFRPLPLHISPFLSFSLSPFFIYFRQRGAEGSCSLSLPLFSRSLLFLNIFRIINSLLSTFASFWYSYLVGGLFPLILTWLYPLYSAHQRTPLLSLLTPKRSCLPQS